MGGKVNNVIYTNAQVTATGSSGSFLQWASECCCGTCFLVKFTERSGVWSTYLSSPIHCQLKVVFGVVTPWTFVSDVLEKRVLSCEVGSACDEYHWQVGEELMCMGRSYSLLKPCYKSIFPRWDSSDEKFHMCVYFKVLMCGIDTMCMSCLCRPQEGIRPFAKGFIVSIVSYYVGARKPTEFFPRAGITPNY